MKLKTCKNQTTPSQNAQRVMIQCRTLVNRDAVRRETIDGVEHIIVSSATLPDDIVMNGGMYPAEEIADSFESLELTLAPVEHPHINGEFLSANDPRAIHDFHAGAFNMNVRQDNGRVHIDKFINVAEAMKTDRGKRLLDRIDELETNNDARPIHTSVGVFVEPEILAKPQTNAAGDEFTWVARNMVFDHDAILLDSVGAAQPHQGVGVAVNRNGEQFTVNQFILDADSQSFTDVHIAVVDALERSAIGGGFIEELFEDHVIFHSGDQLFDVPFVIDDSGVATIVGIPLPVERNVTFTPKTNHSEKGDAMKDLILNALKKAGVDTNGMDESQLFEAFQGLQANDSESDKPRASDNNGDLAEVVANAVATAILPLAQQVEGFQTKLNSADDAEITRLSAIIGESSKYPALNADDVKTLNIDKLKEMAANCQSAFGLSPLVNVDGGNADHLAPTEMVS